MGKNGTDRAFPSPKERRELARRRLLETVGSGGLGDGEAQEIAEDAVRQARSKAPVGEGESPAPSPGEVRKAFGL